MTENTVIAWDRGDDGVVVLTMDDPTQATNTWNDAFRRDFAAAVDRLEAERDDITGVILASAKKTFHAGADLKEIQGLIESSSVAELTGFTDAVKGPLRRLETLGRPVVSVIDGAALGGGLELALATHRRIVVDKASNLIGLPEVQLGAIPGAGGVVRTVRMFGLMNALLNVLAKGQKHAPAKALEVGLVDELVSTSEDLIPAAKAWIAANPDAAQPWDRPKYRMPGGTPADPRLGSNLIGITTNVRKQLEGVDFPAARNLLYAAYEGAKVTYDAAMVLETRYFVSQITNPMTKNMVQAFLALQQLNSGSHDTDRPAGHETFRPRTLAMIGAGMMGAGIAYEYAKAGVEVILKDVTLESAERGKGYSRKIVEKAVAKGRWTQQRADELLARITPTADAADLAGADFMIEAVFEDPDLKRSTYAEVEKHLAEGSLLASNTSQIPIGSLSDGVTRPADFIGMHFSSPVEKMPFVEIVKGAKTSPETVARAVDAVRLIGKTPLVVNDGRGFYLTRLFMSLIWEALDMLAEGIPASSIEQAAAQAGIPTKPLLVVDQISLTLARQVIADERAAAEAAGQQYFLRPGREVIVRMIDDFDRKGRAAGAGFYDYEDGRRLGFWPGLVDAFGGDKRVDIAELKERMTFIIALEVLKCRAEGIVETDTLADVGSIMAGFPATTGGALRFAHAHPGGIDGFTARARQLAAAHGDRFLPVATPA